MNLQITNVVLSISPYCPATLPPLASVPVVLQYKLKGYL